MLASFFHVPGLAGFHSSAASTALDVGALLKPLALVPPVTSTVPSASSVALICRRATDIAPARVHTRVAQQVDHSRPSPWAMPPPTTRIFPASYITAEP